jgi:methionine synthase II (cobalamin-independent)
VSSYYLEYDTPRAGGFEPLKELPTSKNVILGVITSKFPEMEKLEEMKEKVFKAAKFIAEGNNESEQDSLKRMGVSPQCGEYFFGVEASHGADPLIYPTHDNRSSLTHHRICEP